MLRQRGAATPLLLFQLLGFYFFVRCVPPLAAYGEDGIVKMLQLLKSEFEMTMRLCGAPTIADIKPEMVITDNLKDHIAGTSPSPLRPPRTPAQQQRALSSRFISLFIPTGRHL